MSETSTYTFEQLSQKIGLDLERERNLVLKISDYDYTIRQIENSPKDTTQRAQLMAQLKKDDPYLKDKAFELKNAQNVEESILALQLTLSEKLTAMGKEHPEVQAVDRRIKALKQIIHDRNKDTDNLNFSVDPLSWYRVYVEGELAKDKEKLKIIQKEINADKLVHSVLSKLTIEEKSLMLTQEQLDREIKTLENRIDTISVNRDSPTTEAKLITPPEMGVKVAPLPMQYLAIAGFLGLIAGCALAYLAEMTDRSFKSPDEIRRRLGTQIIGHIPVLRPLEEDNPKFDMIDGKLITAIKSKSVESEAYRGVRTSLYFNTREKGHQIIQITSPNAGDGKSTLAANLAVSVAQSGKKVILIDCDFRKPRVHKIFGLDQKSKSEVGIVSVLLDQVELYSAIQECEEIPGLWLLPADRDRKTL